MIIKDLETAHAQTGARIVEVNLNCIVLHSNHPKNVVHVDVHVVVMDLLSENCRSDRTGVQVKSNKGERALMLAAIGCCAPVIVLVPVPPPWMFVSPTNPLKSVI